MRRGAPTRMVHSTRTPPTLSRREAVLERASHTIGVIDGAVRTAGITDHRIEALSATTYVVGPQLSSAFRFIMVPAAASSIGNAQYTHSR